MMHNIGEQLQEHTNAFKVATQIDNVKILDFCMAPGGFLSTALRYNPQSQALAFSLPPAMGGHKVLLREKPSVNVIFRDITMLAGDMGVTELPIGQTIHADADNFSFLPQIRPETLFDLVICDGQVLRTHERASYRESREPIRLSTTQLSIGMQHLRSGGTIVMLLHKSDALWTFSLIYTFSKFAAIQLFKPRPFHAMSSSFYLVATNIQTTQPEAISAIDKWKKLWTAATFEDDEGFGNVLGMHHSDPQTMLDEFGSDFVKLAIPVWAVQAEKLAKTSWTR